MKCETLKVKMTGGKITATDAGQMKQESLQSLKEHLQKAAEGINKIISIHSDGSEGDTKVKLTKIQKQIETIRNESLSSQDSLKTGKLTQLTKTLVNFFTELDSDFKFMREVIMTETAVVLVNSSVRALHDAQSILEDPSKGDMDSLTYDAFYEHIAKEIKERFPTFLGYQIKASSRQQGVYIWVQDPPRIDTKEVPSIFEAFPPKVEEFLNWELRKLSDGFRYRVTPIREGRSGMILCEIKSCLLSWDGDF